ncbi:MAG: DegV family protein [Candidatus Heimdallarchaeota archaeon]|nr:DegV family protein [Candidatus Heimdallarchaeota archaeon]MCK5142175.1 DegV family protein [Candidatus Heimdallarchaeota archaeon]
MEIKKVKVIVDSTCDLPQELAEKFDIDIVPVYIHYEDKMYADGIDLKVEDYYKMLREFKELPTTSAPSPKDFLDKISEAMKSYSTIFITTLSSKLSATFQSARIVTKRIKDKQIHLIDSKFGSGVLAFVSLAIAKLARRGVPEEEIVRKVEEIRDESLLVGYVDNLDNLKKSGRISNLRFFVGNLLKAKPIIELKDGVLEPVDKAAGKEKAQNRVIEEILSRINKNKQYDLMITHGDDKDAADKIMKELETKITLGEKIINYLTPALATHLGIGTIVVSLSPSP